MLMLIGSNKDRNRDRDLGRQERFRRGEGKNMVIDGRVTRSSVAQAGGEIRRLHGRYGTESRKKKVLFTVTRSAMSHIAING